MPTARRGCSGLYRRRAPQVPRHLFTFGASLERTYERGSVVTKRDANGMMLSTVSAPTTIAMMLAQTGELDDARALEIGGYNATLVRELIDPRGSVTTTDADVEACA